MPLLFSLWETLKHLSDQSDLISIKIYRTIWMGFKNAFIYFIIFIMVAHSLYSIP